MAMIKLYNSEYLILPDRKSPPLWTKILLQELSLRSSIALEIRSTIGIEVATRNDVNLFGFSSTGVGFDSNVCRGKNIVLSNGHQQRSR